MPLRKADYFLIIFFVLSAFLFLVFFRPNGKGSQVIISIGGEVYKTVALENPGTDFLDIQNEHDSNRLRFENGGVFMESADCPDGLCMRQASISKVGETIICLPHRIVVELKGKTVIDAVAE